jgi:hypothetical protein
MCLNFRTAVFDLALGCPRSISDIWASSGNVLSQLVISELLTSRNDKVGSGLRNWEAE